MKRIKRPGDYIEDFINAKAQLHFLNKEYVDKIKGEVYKKRSSYYYNKIRACKKIIANYCQPEFIKIRTWILTIERTLESGMVKTERISISLDSTYSDEEVTKLVQFNLNCIVTQINCSERAIHIGKIKYL